MIPPEARERTRRDVATRVCLVLASVLLAPLLCEAALRVLFPKYRDAAEGRLQPDDMRIYAPVPLLRQGELPCGRRGAPFRAGDSGQRRHPSPELELFRPPIHHLRKERRCIARYDLPERIQHGHDNQDFHQAGVTFGERCVVRWHLPDYPVRRIRTGQYVVVRDASATSGRAKPRSTDDLRRHPTVLAPPSSSRRSSPSQMLRLRTSSPSRTTTYWPALTAATG